MHNLLSTIPINSSINLSNSISEFIELNLIIFVLFLLILPTIGLSIFSILVIISKSLLKV